MYNNNDNIITEFYIISKQNADVSEKVIFDNVEKWHQVIEIALDFNLSLFKILNLKNDKLQYNVVW